MQYFSQTGNSSSSLDGATASKETLKPTYQFSESPISFIESDEEEITKEDEIKFYKKAFETKGI